MNNIYSGEFLMKTQDVIFEEKGNRNHLIGIIILNRPGSLNALNHSMVNAISAALDRWDKDKDIKAVVIKGNGDKAFCAGGDIRQLYQERKNSVKLKQFFYDEYQLNRKIFHYKKPYFSLLHGIVMGGGLGISIHGKYKIAAPNLKLAMPEAKIGFFPDVGSSYFLSRLENSVGIYLALTGEKLDVADAIFLGLVDFPIDCERFDEIMDALLVAGSEKDLSMVHHLKKSVGASEIEIRVEKIKKHFSHPTIEQIFNSLLQDVDPWAKKNYELLHRMSPLSLKVILKQMQLAKNLSFDECIDMEYRMVQHFILGGDFFEGIRALVIDKDNQPKWKIPDIRSVSNIIVEGYFI